MKFFKFEEIKKISQIKLNSFILRHYETTGEFHIIHVKKIIYKKDSYIPVHVIIYETLFPNDYIRQFPSEPIWNARIIDMTTSSIFLYESFKIYILKEKTLGDLKKQFNIKKFIYEYYDISNKIDDIIMSDLDMAQRSKLSRISDILGEINNKLYHIDKILSIFDKKYGLVLTI